MEDDADIGHLILEPGDLNGNYDYIADIESMQIPDKGEILIRMRELIALAQSPETQQALMLEGWSLKTKDILEDTFEQAGIKDASKYFERMQGGLNAGLIEQGGAQGSTGSPATAGAVQPGGLGGSSKTPSVRKAPNLLG